MSSQPENLSFMQRTASVAALGLAMGQLTVAPLQPDHAPMVSAVDSPVSPDLPRHGFTPAIDSLKTAHPVIAPGAETHHPTPTAFPVRKTEIATNTSVVYRHQAPSVPKPSLAPAVNPTAKPVAVIIRNTPPASPKPKPVELPAPVIPKPPTPTESPTEGGDKGTITLTPLNLDKLVIPSEVTASMEHDVTYIPSLGCTGSLLRNQDGVAIGVVTAEHCSLRGNGNDSRTRYTGTDGKTYITMFNGIEVQTGNDYDHLATAGKVTTFIAPAAQDSGLDLVVGAFDGYTSEEVLANYNAASLSETELAQLKVGDPVFLSGWPGAQPDNHGVNRRQSFATAFIGRGDVTTTIGETIEVTWTAVMRDKDGAVCSFGDSGGEGFVMQDGQKRSVGVLSAFVDFTGKTYGTPESGEAAKQFYQAKYGIDLTGVDAICGFANQIPSGKDYDVLHVVNRPADIPGFTEAHSEAAQLANARQQFFDQNYHKNIVDGVVGVTNYTTGEISWKLRPTIFYDPETFSTVIASYNADMPNSLELDYVENMFSLNIYAEGSETGGILTSDGTVTIDQTNSDFIDSHGLAFGSALLNAADVNTSKQYSFGYDYQNKVLTTYDESAYAGGK